MKYTKEQIKTAFYLLLDEHLKNMECKLIEERGNYLCKRCDDCMFEQYIKRSKAGEKCRKERNE